MDIFYDNVIFYLQKYGGISRYFSEMIRRIAGYDDARVRTLKHTLMLPRRLIRLNTIYIDFMLTRHKFDIYHPTYYSGNVKRGKANKVIVTVYDMIHEMFSSRFKELGIGLEIKKNSILNADHIICISRATKNDLINIYDIKEGKISIVHLGVSLTDGNPSSRVFNKHRKPYLLYVGRRDWYKNFSILLRAYSLLDIRKDFDLVCFGGGAFLRNELSEIRKLKLENSIQYVEGSDKLLQFYYKNARLFVLTSLCEGFGLPVLEAMANGCPVVASNRGSVPEIASDSALLFSPDNADELSSHIKLMLNDSGLRSEYIKRGGERIKEFSWEKTALETYKIYKKVLNG